MAKKYSWMCLFCGRDLKDSERCIHQDDIGTYDLTGLFSEEEKIVEREKLKALKEKSKYPECWEPRKGV
jgi:hypothetical protein